MTAQNDPRPASPVGGEALLPCPFCGTSSASRKHLEGTVRRPAFQYECDHCGATAPWSDQGDELTNWNRRAALSAPSVTGEAVDRVLVPREPTEAMLEAGDRAMLETAEMDVDSPADPRSCWDAMLAAAPVSARDVDPKAVKRLKERVERWTGPDYLGDERLEVDDAVDLAHDISAVLAALSPTAVEGGEALEQIALSLDEASKVPAQNLEAAIDVLADLRTIAFKAAIAIRTLNKVGE